MARIQITPSELLAQSTEMENLKRQYETLFQQVNNILKNVNENWSPNLANNFAGKITAAQSCFSKIAEMLGTGAELTKGSAESFASIDKQLAAKFFNEKSSTAGGGGAASSGGGNFGGGSGGGRFTDSATDTGDYLTDSRNSAGKALEQIEEWRNTDAGKGAEFFYDLFGKTIGDNGTFGTAKSAWDITTDIITGDVGWDTAEAAVDVLDTTSIGVFGNTVEYVHENIDTLNGINDRMMKELMEGDLLGFAAATGEGFLMIGKGVVDVIATPVKKLVETGEAVIDWISSWF